MENRVATLSQEKAPRVAGLLYLLLAILGGFAQFVRLSLTVDGDATKTTNNIEDSLWLFRIAFVSDLIGQVVFVFVALSLYVLLKPVNENIAKFFVFFAVLSVPIVMLNMLNHYAVLELLSGEDYLGVYSEQELQAQVMFRLNMHATGYLIAQLWFGLWLLPLGYLVYKSGYFPKILGVGLMLGCLGYLIDFFVALLFPDLAPISFVFSLLGGLGEVSFILWLVIKGANIPKTKSELID